MKNIRNSTIAIASSFAVALFTVSLAAPVQAHGGGLDWQGGHNCRVGSCAGTYHCHQPRGGICAKGKSRSITLSEHSGKTAEKVSSPL